MCPERAKESWLSGKSKTLPTQCPVADTTAALPLLSPNTSESIEISLPYF